MEWETGKKGYLAWFYDDAFVWSMDATSFGAYEVCSDASGTKTCSRTPPRQIPEEPMSLVMNTAIGTWNGGQTALDGKHWPAKHHIDHVRVWQREVNVSCDPPDYPTKVYINKNHALYGEPVKPVGYDTCPEIYPASAYAHADEIKKRGATMSATALFAAGGSSGAKGADAGAATPSFSSSVGVVGALLVVGVLGAFYYSRRPARSPHAVEEFAPAEVSYTAM